MSTTGDTANRVIDKEVDARFWSSTGYKPGQKLDMSIPTDVAMSKVWNAIHQQVLAEDAAGTLRLTYNHPDVRRAVADASVADQVAAKHLDAAVAATDKPTRAANLNAATTADAVKRGRVDDAAAHIAAPPVPPEVHAEAARDASAAPPPPDASAAHHLAHHQATTTPKASKQPGQAVKHSKGKHDKHPVEPTIHPVDLAIARKEAPALATNAAGNFVGVMHMPDTGTGEAVVFSTHAELVDWYNHGISTPSEKGWYLAAYDKGDPAWPEPLADGLGGEAAVLVTAAPPPPPPSPIPPPQPQPSQPVTPSSRRSVVIASPDPKKLPGGNTATILAVGLLGVAAFAWLKLRKSPHDTIPDMHAVADVPTAKPARTIARSPRGARR